MLKDKPIYIFSNNKEAESRLIMLLINRTRHISEYSFLERKLRFYLRNECLYLVPTSEDKYELYIAKNSRYSISSTLGDLSQDAVKELQNIGAINETNEYKTFSGYKVIDKNYFEKKYDIDIENVSDMYLLKLNTSHYNLILKNYIYEQVPFLNIKISEVEKLLQASKIEKVEYKYDLISEKVILEGKDINIRINYPTMLERKQRTQPYSIRRNKHGLYEARRRINDRVISAWGHSEGEAQKKLRELYREHIIKEREQKRKLKDSKIYKEIEESKEDEFGI